MSDQSQQCQLPTASQRRRTDRRVFRPNTDVLGTHDGTVLFLDVPGAGEGDLDIDLDKDRLTVRAKVAESVDEGLRPLRREYAVGDYVRTFQLPDDVDRDRVDATLSDGVLRIELPSRRGPTTRKVDVRRVG